MRSGLRRVFVGVAAWLLCAIAAIVWSARPGNPALFPAGDDGTDILLVSNGYHAGLIIPVPLLAEVSGRKGMSALSQVAARFRRYDWIEIGWGDADFDRAPDAGSLHWGLAFNALMGRGSGSVLHIAGIEGKPEGFFAAANLVRIAVSPAGLEQMALGIDATFALSPDAQPESLGPGLYGPSLFYRARGHFNLFRVCNHWLVDLLDAAGIPITPIISILPAGILSDLKWRSGLTASPHA
jgi:uncharacterized protein (TIGR02117 family)